MVITKQLIDLILGNDHILDQGNTEVSEVPRFTKEFLPKVPTFELLRPVRTCIKKYRKLILKIKFVDEFHLLVKTQ